LCPFDGEPLSFKRVVDEFVGIVLDDKYRLEERVGEGGMGTVYRATHIQMENTVAVKILRPHLASDRTAVERFRREARSAARIRHPNAVAVTDFGVTRDAGIAYLVMEFLEGRDLRQKIKQKGRLDLEETASILSQTCSAVSVAHSKGIIHRDLKPDNIWLIKTDKELEHVKVLDFGIAKLKATTDAVSLTQGAIIGTPYYMSPEQCRGEELDSGSDVYGLGVILYEMLTGRVPFTGFTPLEVVLQHSTERPRPLRELRPDIPEPVERVVLRALEKKREVRQTSAVQLTQEFEAAVYAAGKHPGFLAEHGPESTLAVKSHMPELCGGDVSNPPPSSSEGFDSGGDYSKRAAVMLTQSTLVNRDRASQPVKARETSQPLIAGQARPQAYLVNATKWTPTTWSAKSYLILAGIAIVLVGAIAASLMSSSVKSHLESDTKSIYRLRATVVDPQGMPVEDAKIWSSIGGEAKKVAGGWQFDIPVASKPAGGDLTVYASRETAFLTGKQDIQLGDDLNPASKVQLSHDTSASVTGFIQDSRGGAVSGARVSIASSPESVFTGAAGNFLLAAHAAINEPVLVRVEKDGFSSVQLWHPAGEHPATIVLERR
jgi:serine/threonine protein kinase